MAVKIKTAASAEWAATATWAAAPQYVTAWMGNNFLAESNAISGLRIQQKDDVYRLLAGEEIVLNITPANGAVNDADAAFVSLIQEATSQVVLSLRLHSGDPGSDHTANELTAATSPGYSRRSVAWAVSI